MTNTYYLRTTSPTVPRMTVRADTELQALVAGNLSLVDGQVISCDPTPPVSAGEQSKRLISKWREIIDDPRAV